MRIFEVLGIFLVKKHNFLLNRDFLRKDENFTFWGFNAN
ncbi:hypothetical protein EcB7A_2781 [Escherichia coli B7A]|nr:hypothetical protein EcB7A_2781 [Escherichia coli B7A]